MLANNHICIVQAQNFKVMQREYMKKVIPGVNISVLMSLGQMFVSNSNLAYAYACEAYKLFVVQGRCSEYDFQSSYNLLAHYGVALSGMFFAYELKTGKMDLYTSSLSLLKQLATRSFLKGKKQPIALELQDIEKKLYESDRIKKSIKDGYKLIAVRLDYEVVGSGIVFTPTIPRSPIDLNEYIVVPFDTVNEAMSVLNAILQEKVLRITQGDKVRVVTKNIQLLNSIYGGSRAQYLVSQVPDARVLRFYMPSLGASVYTAGITNIHLEAIDSIELVGSLADVDLSEIKLDYSHAKDFFIKSIKGLPAKDIKKIAEDLNVQQYNANAKESKEGILEVVDCLYDREVYTFMKEHPQYFNIGLYKTIPSKYGDKYEDVRIPSTIEELRTLLSKGIYKILSNNRTGTLSTVICSNDSRCLMHIYGNKYFKNYESDGVRLRALKSEITKKYGNGLTDIQLEMVCTKYGLKNLAYEISDFSNSTKVHPAESILKVINVNEVEFEKKKTVITQPHLVVVRSCEAKLDKDGNPVGYYKNIDLKSVISITRLSDGVSKSSK